MGCFLACFGSCKDQKRRKQSYRVRPQDQRHSNHQPVQLSVSLKQENTGEPRSNGPQISDKPEEKLSFSSRKKVTFDTNVKTYEHIPFDEIADSSPETIEDFDKEKEEDLAKQTQSHSSLPDDSKSTTSSLRSCPPNHRYQNCGDDDEEELDLEGSDNDDIYNDMTGDDDDDEGQCSDGLYDEDDDWLAEKRANISADQVVTEEIESIGLNQNARDRSRYVHPVLNPVENLTQWKAVKKAKGTHQLKPQKENLHLDQELRVPFSLEPSFKESSFSLKSECDQPRKAMEEIAVDASLSNWLVSPETTPKSKGSSTIITNSLTITPETCESKGSNSFTSLEDRPILGALTMEELKQISASSSPRKSPHRNPDDMPIIGSVGSYWTHATELKNSGSASSPKGIRDTPLSKYGKVHVR